MRAPLCVYLLGSSRLDCRAAFHPALDDGSNAVDGHAHEVRLPRLVGKRAQHSRLLVGWYGKLHKDDRDGGRTYLRRHLCQFIHFASVSVQVLTLYSFTCILASPGQPISQKGDILFSKRNTQMLTEKRNYVWARRSHRVCVVCSLGGCLCTPPAHMRRTWVVHTRHRLGRRGAYRARLAALCPSEDSHQQRQRYLWARVRILHVRDIPAVHSWTLSTGTDGRANIHTAPSLLGATRPPPVRRV